MLGDATPAFPRLRTYVEQVPARKPRPAPRRVDPGRAERPGRPEAIAAGAILAFYILTRLLLLWRMPHFIDEATHAKWTFDAYHDPAARFESLTQAKEPLLIWLAAGFMKLGANPLTAIRWVSFFAGLLAMSMVALLARRIGGNRLALAAAGIYAVLPFVFVHDVIGIMDPLVTALLATALVLQLKLAERPRLDVALGLGIVMAAAVLTKETGKVALVLLPFSLLLFDWSPLGRLRRLAAWTGCAAISVALTGVGLLVLHLSPLYARLDSLRQLQLAYPVRTLHEGLAHPIRWLGDSLDVYPGAFLGYVTAPLLLLFAVGVVALARTRWRLTAVLLVWILAPLAAAVLLAVHPYPRYVLYVVPPMIVFIAVGGETALRWIWERVQPDRRVPVLAAVGVVALAPALFFDARVTGSPASTHYPVNDDVQYVTGWESGSGLNQIADTLRRMTKGKPAIVIYTSGYSDALRFLVDNPRLLYVSTTSKAVPLARYLVEFPHAKEFPDFAEGALLPGFRLVQTVHRPRSDLALRLYVRR